MAFVRNALAAAALAGISIASQAAGTTLLTWSAPDNYAPNSLSNLGTGVLAASSATTGVFNQAGNYLLNAQGVATFIGGKASNGAAISADGNTIGSTANLGGIDQAAFYNLGTGTWTSAGTLAGGNGTSAFGGMSSDGTSIVGYSNGANGKNHAFVSRNGQTYDLTPAASFTTTAVAVSNGGRVVVGLSGNNNTSGTIWTWNNATQGYDSALSTVASIGDGSAAEVAFTAISANGNWAGGSSTNSNYMSQGFGYGFFAATLTNTATNTTINIPYDHTLALVASGVVDPILNWKANVTGVTDSGTVIGAFNLLSGNRQLTALTSTDAFIYFAGTNTSMSFDSYLSSIGVTLTSTQHVYSLSSISADGNNISGLLFDTSLGGSGQTVGFELQGANITVVPEPGQWALLALGLPLLLARRMRRES